MGQVILSRPDFRRQGDGWHDAVPQEEDFDTVSRPTDELTAVAAAAVRRAAALCRSVQSGIDRGAMTKGDKSPVTVADYGSQALIGRALVLATPEIPLVAEEDSADLRKPEHAPLLGRTWDLVRKHTDVPDPATVCDWIDHGKPVGGAPRFWTLDPIDGTKGFLRGDQYAVALALIDGGRIEVAAMACPNLGAGPGEDGDHPPGRLFLAARGQGARAYPLDAPDHPGWPVRASEAGSPAGSRYCERIEGGDSAKDTTTLVAEALGLVLPPKRLDSQAKYAVVARGEVEVYLRLPTDASYQEKIWDHAAGALVLEEAGGTITDAFGAPLDFTRGTTLAANRGIVATNGRFHQQVLDGVAKIIG